MTSPPPRIALVVGAAAELAEPLFAPAFLGLARRGWDVHLIFDGAEPALWPSVQRELSDPELARRIHLSPVHKPRGWQRTALSRGLLSALARRPGGAVRHALAGGVPRPAALVGRDVEGALIALGPDLVHFHSPASAARRLRVRRLLGCQTVVSFPGEEAGEGVLEIGPRRAVWEGADVLHFPDEAAHRAELQRGLPTGAPSVVFPLPTADRLLTPATREAHEALRIVSVGPLSWRSGYEWAMQTVRLLVDGGVACEYRIVGRGPFLEALSFARHQLGLEGVVELAEARGREEVEAHLQWADALLDATVVAGVTSAVPDAQAMALPVVVTDRTQAPEGALDVETGFVVPRRDPAALADRLARLATDPALRARMGETARRRRLDRWRLEDHLTELESLYERTLAGRG